VKNNIYACLEIGSSEARILVCNIRENRVYVLSQQGVETEGLENGHVAQLNPLVQKLKALKVHVESDLNQPLQTVTLSIPSVDVTMENLQLELDLDPDEAIGPEQIKKLFRQAMSRPAPIETVSVNLIPRLFKVDEAEVTSNPTGQKGKLLMMEAQRAVAPAMLVYELINAVELAGFRVGDIMVGSTAEVVYSLGLVEPGKNSCHVNIGKFSTTISIAHGGKIHSTKSLSVGGQDATEDISEVLYVDELTANKLKHHFGSVQSRSNPQEFIYVNELETGFSCITRGMLENVLIGRYEMILKVVKQYLNENALKTHDMAYVLTGGASEVEGLVDFAQQFFGEKVSLQRPAMLGIRQAKYAKLVGMAILAHELALLTGQKAEIIDFSQYANTKGTTVSEMQSRPPQDKSFMDHKLENSGVLVRLFDMIFDEKAQ